MADAEDLAQSIHERYVRMLMDKVREDQYPSHTMIEILQNNTHGEERAELINILLDKVEGDRFPSVDMLNRIARLAG